MEQVKQALAAYDNVKQTINPDNNDVRFTPNPWLGWTETDIGNMKGWNNLDIINNCNTSMMLDGFMELPEDDDDTGLSDEVQWLIDPNEFKDETRIPYHYSYVMENAIINIFEYIAAQLGETGTLNEKNLVGQGILLLAIIRTYHWYLLTLPESEPTNVKIDENLKKASVGFPYPHKNLITLSPELKRWVLDNFVEKIVIPIMADNKDKEEVKEKKEEESGYDTEVLSDEDETTYVKIRKELKFKTKVKARKFIKKTKKERMLEVSKKLYGLSTKEVYEQLLQKSLDMEASDKLVEYLLDYNVKLKKKLAQAEADMKFLRKQIK